MNGNGSGGGGVALQAYLIIEYDGLIENLTSSLSLMATSSSSIYSSSSTTITSPSTART
jgi:hypothetical protein